MTFQQTNTQYLYFITALFYLFCYFRVLFSGKSVKVQIIQSLSWSSVEMINTYYMQQ